jgi:hypothetical protein
MIRSRLALTRAATGSTCVTGTTPLATAGISGVHTVRAVSTATLARPAAGSTEHQDTILTATEVHAYYRLGRTAGYQLTKRLASASSSA